MPILLLFLLSSFLLGLGYGISVPLVSLVLEDRGISSDVIGLAAAASSAGVLLAMLTIPSLIRRFGLKRVTKYASLLAVVQALLYSMIDGPIMAFTLRFFAGLLFGPIWVIIENSLVRVAPSCRRLSWISLSAVAFIFAVASGNSVMALFFSLDISWANYGLDRLPLGSMNPRHGAMVIPILSFEIIRHVLLMILINRIGRLEASPRISLQKVLGIAWRLRLPIIASFTSGALELTFIGLGPIYLLRLGYTEARALILTTVFFLGGGLLLFMFQVIWRGSKEKLMIAGSFVIIVAASLMLTKSIQWGVPGTPSILAPYALYSVFGLITYVLYCVSLLMIVHRLPENEIIYGNSALIISQIVAAGMFPPSAGKLMEYMGTSGFQTSLLIIGLLGVVAILFDRNTNTS